MKSSFIRKSNIILPKATKPSIYNGQLLISTGLHELDEILGGGLAVGTILLIEEDFHSKYYIDILKYFLSEGIAVDHKIFFISADETEKFIQKLPQNLTLEMKKEEEKEIDENLTIAWQYKKYLPNKISSNSSYYSGSLKASKMNIFCHSYDLSRVIKAEYLENKSLLTLNIQNLIKTEDIYIQLYKQLKDIIVKEFKSDIKDKNNVPNILRIGIHSIASTLWYNDVTNFKSLFMFLHSLKGLLRHSLASCIITFPVNLYPTSIIHKVENLCDTVVSFHSFDKYEEKIISETFKEYDGHFFIKKLPHLNSLVSHIPETLNYVFKLKRRKLHIEILHLGPEESRTSKKQFPPKKLSNLDF